MFSLTSNEFLTFLSEYFKIDSKTIIQKSLDHNIILSSDSDDAIVNKLKSHIGFQRRLLEPLSVALTKSTPFDTIVSLLAFKDFEKHSSLLIADHSNIFKLIVFKKDNNFPNLQINYVYKIDSCFFKEGKLLTNIPPKFIWFYDFYSIFTIRDYFLDNLPECIYDEEYTKITNMVNIIGYLFVNVNNEKIFYFIHSKQLQIRIIPFKLEELDQSFSTKLVRISYCELDYGPDAYQLKMTEFSEFISLSTFPITLTAEQFKSLIRFEYPSCRMSLSELTEKSVAITKIKIMSIVKNELFWQFYGYDASEAVIFTVFDEHFAEQFALLITDSTILLIDGIYRHDKKFYIRERIENIHQLDLEEEDEITIPITNIGELSEEKMVIIDVLVTEVLEKTFQNKDNKREGYEKIRGISNDLQITLHNYNMNYFKKLLVGNAYRFFFVKSRFFNDNIYFTCSNYSSITKVQQ